MNNTIIRLQSDFGGYLKKKQKKKRAIKLVTHVEPHASAVNLLKRAENSTV